ncbi:unnamed protein product [Rhizophagus irregularis]|uniref:FAR1 domain-containing protein n=1 Tax=Rhizophagus irregularis TaxID=588596 RepID=A0A2N1N3P4_9GLOM|nr:hypothetical protein RhiirC2_782208 [Rhizophagus irregularis]CAB5362749.1 unnamed protein product [Rhizophagus irregularis]
MSDNESMSSDDSDTELFNEEFLQNISDDNDSSSDDDCFEDAAESNSTLKLEVGQTFFSWKTAFSYIKQWTYHQGFFIRKGRSEKVDTKRRKQTIVCHCEGVYINKSKKNKSKLSKSQRTNCKWHVNLSQPVQNNPDNVISITTLFNKHFRHNLDPSACYFETKKAFTKPMLDDIEWMSLYGCLKLLEIKRMLRAKYNQKVYNKDLYKVIYKHRKTKAQESNDMSRLLVHLEKCKENDPRWIIFKDWDHEINTLTKIFWMTPEQIET